MVDVTRRDFVKAASGLAAAAGLMGASQALGLPAGSGGAPASQGGAGAGNVEGKAVARVYREDKAVGNPYRQRYFDQMADLVRRRHAQATVRREAAFRPDCSSPEAYEASIATYRRQFVELLGWPLAGDDAPVVGGPVPLRLEHVAEEELGRIDRVWIETLEGLETYGLLFTPPGEGPHPLVISQHGGGGTPEVCSGFLGPDNYNGMTRRVWRRGAVVFAPQLYMWSETYGPATNRPEMDAQLKQLGGSMAALDIFQLSRCIDALAQRPTVAPGRVGMLGLSWGGFTTLVTAAVETRLRGAYASCFFNTRRLYPMTPAVWQGGAERFQDAEIAAMVCPRRLYIEVGRADELFSAASAAPEAAKVRAIYDRLGLGGRFVYCEHSGGHALDTDDAGINFLMAALEA
ncbi:MAG: twin-arginine translocation signal domain-containing protein [Planctomycetes bacterium]|nr:twin-arginine translocation signal domain-containing protein [Planctomycetota bacterium]